MRPSVLSLALAVVLIALGGCGDDGGQGSRATGTESSSATTASATNGIDRVVNIGGARGLYLWCTGTGSPTVLMEGGDGDASDSYAFAEPAVSRVTRTCVYDRANLGRSNPAPGPRGLSDLVGDLERC